jgi:outer membrane protein OmpA-like peptidoglycan-associated protein
MNFKGLVLIFFGITVSWMIGSITPSNAQENCTDVTKFESSTNTQTGQCLIHFNTDQDHPFDTRRMPLDTDLRELRKKEREKEVDETVNFIRTLHDREDVTIHHIRIDGHTDTQASNAYNLELSRRRAETVRSLLTDEKVNRLYQITPDHAGEDELTVPTADDFDEPANRRVVITLCPVDQIDGSGRCSAPAVLPFLVHFDTDKRNPNDLSEVETAVNGIKDFYNSHNVRILVYGHADTVSDADYNLALSRRRAETVNSLLRLDLGDRYNTTVDHFGEKTQVVSTADEIDEPANRRVEIILCTPGIDLDNYPECGENWAEEAKN